MEVVTEPLADAVTGFVKPAAGGQGFDFASIFKSLFSGFFATGGYIAPGRWGIAGDQGPEPVFGGRTGATVQPAGGVSVVNHFTISGPVDRRTQAQLSAAAGLGVQRAMARNT